MELYVYKNNQRLRCGYTTGSCAAAAAKAAARMLIEGVLLDKIDLMTPKGILLSLDLLEVQLEKEYASCAIRKDSGDDFDVTNGILVYAKVCRGRLEDSSILIDGGIGVGRVTKPGLDQPVGNAAINRVPRQMIEGNVREVCEDFDYCGGLFVEISIPDGTWIAAKTFNPRLGIEGGISILGTSGIVEPMSEKALVDTIRTEMKMLSTAGRETLIVTPGNYGETFVKEQIDFHGKTVKCSNFIGEAIDMAYEFNVKGLLLIGHIGKLVKLGAGIMNTHSREADGRMEVLAACALSAGADLTILKQLIACVTTDEALDILKEANYLEETMNVLMERINFHLERRAYDGLQIGAIVFSNKFGELGRTSKVADLFHSFV